MTGLKKENTNSRKLPSPVEVKEKGKRKSN